MGTKLTDYAVMINNYDDNHLQISGEDAFVQERIDITDDIWIGPIDALLRDSILDSCEPYGLYKQQSREFFGNYAFVRENPPEQKSYFNWDSDGRLQNCIQLSRLIRPTSLGFRYAARVETRNNELGRFIPGPVNAFGSEVFIAQETSNWLRKQDCEELRKLCAAFSLAKVSKHVTAAMFYLETAFRIAVVDIRWTLVAIGLESLIHTDRNNAKRQFTERLHVISSQLGCSISTSQFEEMWEGRCSLAHGQQLISDRSRNFEPYTEMETLLRLILKNTIEDSHFAQLFEDTDKIRKSFPI